MHVHVCVHMYLPAYIHTTILCAPFYRFCEMDDEVRYVDNVLSTTRPGVGVNIIFLLLEGILFFILTLLIEVSQQGTNTRVYMYIYM